MKNGLHRNIRLIFYNFSVYGPQFLIGIAFLFLYGLVLGWGIPTGGMTALFALIITMSMSMSGITAQYKYAVGFGSTKRNFFTGGFFNKLLYAFYSTAITGVISSVTDFYPFNKAGGILLLLASSMLFGALGEFYGLMMFKSQKAGFLVYIISFCVLTFTGIGVFIHFLFKYPDTNLLELLYSNISVSLALTVITALFAALSAINWKLLAKMEIRS